MQFQTQYKQQLILILDIEYTPVVCSGFLQTVSNSTKVWQVSGGQCSTDQNDFFKSQTLGRASVSRGSGAGWTGDLSTCRRRVNCCKYCIIMSCWWCVFILNTFWLNLSESEILLSSSSPRWSHSESKYKLQTWIWLNKISIFTYNLEISELESSGALWHYITCLLESLARLLFSLSCDDLS